MPRMTAIFVVSIPVYSWFKKSMPLTYNANLVRQHDPDRFLLSLFAPRSVRPALWALFAFNTELVRTRAMVTDTNLGLIRLQWWRDEIARLYAGGDGGQTPILSTLAPLVHAQILPQALFDDLLYAREFDLEDVAPASMEGLRHYADFTTTPLNRLALKIVGEHADDDEIREISTNFGLMEAVRGVPLSLSQRRCLIPSDLLLEKNLTPQKIMDFDYKQDVSQLVSQMAESIDSYRKPKSALLRRQQAMANIYLKKMKNKHFDAFLGQATLPPPFLALRLLLS